MTLQELRFLIALAQEKHFGKASRICFVSQPTLSIAIRKLERELKVTLFERDKNDVRITPLGFEIVERAKRVLADVDAIKQVAEGDRDQLLGVFKLGVIYTVGPYLLPHMITAINKRLPQMTIEIQEDHTASLRQKLEVGELDAIVISYPFKHASIVTRPLYTEPFVVLMPNSHPLAAFDHVTQKQLIDCNILMLGETHCFRDQVMSACPICFSANKSNRWQTVTGTSLETIKHMIAANMGVSVLPATAAASSPYHKGVLTTRPLKGSHAERVIALAWRKNYPRIKAIDALLKVTESIDVPR